MKNRLSFISCLLIAVVLLAHRALYPIGTDKPLKITDWDALGYYMYLPALIIHHDISQLHWFDEIDEKYAVSGGSLYQFTKVENGNYVGKYLGGVAIVQLPLFLIAHLLAEPLGYPADGFSAPYQYIIAYGIIIYCLLALLLLRRIMLRYFTDRTVAVSLLLLCLATNFVQYAAIHNGMSHVYIFPLYVLILYATIKWHDNPSVLWAVAIGFIIGLATICRPSEAVMLFVPLLWNTQSKEAARNKWAQVRNNPVHVVVAAFAGVIGILPQLIYWKLTSGAWVYDVGSSWRFLTPFFRVLFGWEKGWFIYTPVTIFFIVSLFLLKRYPFKNSVIWFCLLNIYIIISWADWRYGGSYSTRALVQSYPVFVLPFAAFIQRTTQSRWRFLVYIIGAYLVVVNIFQVWQYNKAILEGDMTWKYYSNVYLDTCPTPLDMSLLDTDEILDNEKGYVKQNLYSVDSIKTLEMNGGDTVRLAIVALSPAHSKNQWVKIDCLLKTDGVEGAYLNGEIAGNNIAKHRSFRLHNAISSHTGLNRYTFYMQVPDEGDTKELQVYLTSKYYREYSMQKLDITSFVK